MPQAISIEITTQCSLNCSYCHRNKNTGSYLAFEDFLKFEMQFTKIPNLSRITFCGIGESFLHKEFYRIIKHLKAYRISIVTSGTIPIDYNELNDYKNIDFLIFSIDASSDELIKKICGETYNYTNLIRNLEDLNAYNKVMLNRNGYIFSILNCTVNEYNIEEIPKLIDFAKKYKFLSVHFSLPWGQEEFIRKNLIYLQQKFGEATKKAKQYQIIVDDPFNSYCCIMINQILPYLNITGDVFPCGYALSQKYRIGNIILDDYVNMWSGINNERFKSGDLCRDCFLVQMGNIATEGVTN
jgi:MoaA/NifB/PqqE/SkfB family radical SAM enzyme